MSLTPIKYQEGWLYVDKCYIPNNSTYINNGVLFISDSVYDEGNNPNNSNPRVTDQNYLVVAQSPHLSIPNVPYIEEVDEDIKCPFCGGKMEVFKEYLGSYFYITCISDDGDCLSKNMVCDGEMGTIGISYLTSELTIQDVKKRLAQSKGYRYSEEDLRKAWDEGNKAGYGYPNNEYLSKDEIIQSLNQPKEVEIEMEQQRHPLETNKVKIPYKRLVPVTYLKDGRTYLKVKR